jgi:hypothetical protein
MDAMENDHLEDACRFLRSALSMDAEYGRISRYDIERALEHIEDHRRKVAETLAATRKCAVTQDQGA